MGKIYWKAPVNVKNVC